MLTRFLYQVYGQVFSPESEQGLPLDCHMYTHSTTMTNSIVTMRRQTCQSCLRVWVLLIVISSLILYQVIVLFISFHDLLHAKYMYTCTILLLLLLFIFYYLLLLLL